ncbi:hypothetical protein B484DRAFT_257572 [Ochromonadaceae sp. CCMP2298]|nr:hypothetical protein B484DRAFT_257572 [Ochromonadaceae sp. CCMP2298]
MLSALNTVTARMPVLATRHLCDSTICPATCLSVTRSQPHRTYYTDTAVVTSPQPLAGSACSASFCLLCLLCCSTVIHLKHTTYPDVLLLGTPARRAEPQRRPVLQTGRWRAHPRPSPGAVEGHAGGASDRPAPAGNPPPLRPETDGGDGGGVREILGGGTRGTATVVSADTHPHDTVYRVKVQDVGYRVQGTGYRVQGIGYRVQSAGDRE